MRVRFGFDVEIHRDRDEPEEPDAAEPPMVDQKGSRILDRRPEMDMSSTPMGFCVAPTAVVADHRLVSNLEGSKRETERARAYVKAHATEVTK